MERITKIFEELINSIKEFLGIGTRALLGEGFEASKTNGMYTLKSDYDSFPKYEGELRKYSPIYNNTGYYKRATMFFKYDREKEEAYSNDLINNGFTKTSDVRYDKNIEGLNSYIIVEQIRNDLKVAFHIKLN